MLIISWGGRLAIILAVLDYGSQTRTEYQLLRTGRMELPTPCWDILNTETKFWIDCCYFSITLNLIWPQISFVIKCNQALNSYPCKSVFFNAFWITSERPVCRSISLVSILSHAYLNMLMCKHCMSHSQHSVTFPFLLFRSERHTFEQSVQPALLCCSVSH